MNISYDSADSHSKVPSDWKQNDLLYSPVQNFVVIFDQKSEKNYHEFWGRNLAAHLDVRGTCDDAEPYFAKDFVKMTGKVVLSND